MSSKNKSVVTVLVTGDGSGLKRTLAESQQQLQKTAKDLDDFGKRAMIASGIAAVGLFKAGSAASDLNESLSKSNAVFKDSAKGLESWASGAAKGFGQSKKQALDAAATFGNIFVQLGVGTDVAADLSMEMTELASDFASFHNADITSVIEAQSAAFRGEYDALQKFVPTINAAAVEQRALAMTGKETTKELTAQEKALAVQTLMLEGAGDAMGDFDRTSDGAANQQRILAAELENLKAGIGAGVLPVMQDLVSGLTAVTGGFTSLDAESQAAIGKFATFATAAIGTAGAMSFVAGQAIKLRDRFTTMGADGARSMNRMGTAAGVLGGALVVAGIAAALDEITNKDLKPLAAGLEEVARAADEEIVPAFTNALKKSSDLADVQDGYEALARQSIATAGRLADQLDAQGISSDDLRAVIEKEIAAQKQANADGEAGTEITKEQGGAARSTAAAVLSLADAQQLAAQTARAQADAMSGAFDKMWGAGDIARSADEAIANFGQTLDSTAGSGGRAASSVDLVAKKQEAVAETARAAEDAFRSFRDSSEDLTDAQKGLAAAQQSIVDAQKDLDKAMKGPTAENKADASDDVTDAQLRLEDATFSVEDAQRRLTEAQEDGDPSDVARAQNDYAQAVRSRDEAQKALNGSQKAYNDLATWTAENDPKVAAAQDALSEAVDRAAESQNKVRDATENAALKYGDLNAAADEASKTLDASVESFGASDGSMANNRVNLEATKGKYFELRDSIRDTIVEILNLGLAQAQTMGEFDSLAAKIRSIPSLTDGQRGELLGAVYAGKASAVGFTPGFTGFAEGGIVTGPTRALIGEAGEHEMVLPLSKAGQMGFGGGGGGGVVVQITGPVYGLDDLDRKIVDSLARARRNGLIPAGI